METYHHCRSERHHARERKSRGSFLGTVLVVIGILWILKEIGWQLGLPGWHVVQDAGASFLNIFHFGAISVTWPVILLLVGVLLIVGRRLIGALFLVFAILFLLPHLIIPGILLVLFFPLILIILGIVLISKLF
ncbi:hypothetical protein [Sunxiuqinia indica]|uniref:hypothetical protein n=1 Tax=Sunxiuqinia indica TaxID=2692584 RepID=UPI00135C8E53|nr:hypothetical protein [Sunxiuqinia indica]